jgi:hypothetical protein
MRIAGFARIAFAALVVLLVLLRAMLLGEVGDTFPDPVHARRQVGLAARHLRLHLLAKRALTGGGGCPSCRAPSREESRQHGHRGLALYTGGERGL